MTPPSAIIVGGGLTGMVIARELAIRQWKVLLLERSGRLGGKAGSDIKNGRLVEHGYHVFPKWYPNVRSILERIGVNLVDFDRYHFLLRGEYPSKITVRGFAGIRAMWHNIFRGLLPWYHNILYYYSVLDMMSRPLSEKSFLDRVSQVGLLRGKWYASESVAETGQENVLKASAIPVYELSAMTAKRVSSYWVRQAEPFLSVLPGDLQTFFIEPQAMELEAAGVEIRYGTEVTGIAMNGDRAAGVRMSDGSILEADIYALCTPFEVTRRWVDDSVYQADPDLGNMQFLEAQPMAALHLRLRREIPDLPIEHVFLQGSRYALSFIEVSRLWKELRGKPELSFISSNFGPMNGVSAEKAKDLLLEEICEYLPITPADVESWELNSNTEVPLFINTIAAWPNRPGTKTKIRNVYVAGDFAKNAIDLACMEGAVSAALETAGQILRDQGVSDVPQAKVPPEFARWLLVTARIVLIPGVAFARLLAWIEENLGSRKP